MNEAALVLVSAGVLDRLAGDPVYAAHPVRLIGALIGRLEKALRGARLGGAAGGVLLVLIVNLTSLMLYIGVRLGLYGIHPWAALMWDIFIVYSCIALKDMVCHALPIASLLANGDLPGAREKVQRIVGRDVSLLDSAGVARATVESVAESLVDGFLAPLFWFTATCALACWGRAPALPVAAAAVVVYRATNTMDSMVGYRSETYRLFGRAAARVDDVLNFIPARLSVPVLSLSAAFCGLRAGSGWRVGWRDRLKHASPNSAHAESAVAGALDVRLGGPTAYAHGVVAKPWIGDGATDVHPEHIVQACRLVSVAGVAAMIFGLGVILLCN